MLYLYPYLYLYLLIMYPLGLIIEAIELRTAPTHHRSFITTDGHRILCIRNV
jgi:hypothetical protein